MISRRESIPAATVRLEQDRPDDWRTFASCLGVDVEFFYADGQGCHVPEPVKRMCSACEVRRECLDLALTTKDQWGVFAGVSPRDRRGKQPGDDIPIRLKEQSA